ncbi:MAG: phage tail tape-measure protein [Mesorhizobium sp.]|nr:phage tail tape-measure protein [Mesorhizobium sp. M8A.F.Ca.ET.023.01.1.1]RWC77774.1 MAG: phage tail tape-measure protein [Mesorhizobium sp.]TIS98767.1 MAG: phage tail tape-measure protein [Mesorhizobium sp.]
MADVAQLGIAVDSSGADKGTLGLTKLSTAAEKAESAAAGLSATIKNASAAATSLAASSGNAAAELNQEGVAATKASSALQAHYVAANNNSAAAKNTGYQMRMVAMQLSQVAQQTQAGAGFIQALAIQLPDLALGFGAVGIAFGVLAGILLPLIHAGKLTSDALNFIANSLEAIAPYAVAAAAALALLYAPAILGGLTLLSEAILGVTARLAGLATGFLLANPAVAFVAGITAAVVAVNYFRDELTQIFGVDVVGVAKNAINFIIGSFVGGFQAIKAVWAQLPAALGDIVFSTAQTVLDGIGAMIQKAIDAVNNFTNQAALALAKIGHPLSPEVYNGLTISPIKMGGVGNPNPGTASGLGGSIKDAFGSAMNTDYVGAGMTAIGKAADYSAGRVKELASWLAKVDDPTAKKTKSHGKTDEEKFDVIVTNANTRLATLKAEQASVGMSELVTAKLRYETELLNEAQRKGITLTAGQRAELMGLADQMAETAVQTKNAKEQLAFAKDATKGFMDDLRQGLENGEGFWQSFGNAALNVLDKIIDKIEDELLGSLFSLDSAGGSSGGGVLDLLIGGFKGFATGGYTGRGAANKAAGIVHGGEYVFNKRATDRIGVANLDRMHRGLAPAANRNAPQAANSNSDGPITVTFAPVLQNNGGGSNDDAIKQMRKVFDQEFLPRTVKAIREAKTRGMLS